MRKLFLLSILLAVSISAAPRKNKLVTIASGTPVQLSALANSGCSTTVNQACYVDKLFIQPAIGGSGVVYVMDMSAFIAGTVPSYSTADDVTAQLCAATSTAPGCNYLDTSLPAPASGGIDITRIWIDGSNTGDTVVVSFVLRN
jgi:hypothetical protein